MNAHPRLTMPFCAHRPAEVQHRFDTILNMLDDVADGRCQRDTAHRAVVNILEELVEEAAKLGETQRAVVDILDDLNNERETVRRVSSQLRDQAAARARAEEAFRRADAAAKTATRELDAFTYSVAHNLRAPLRSIDGFSQVLLEDCAASLPADGMTYLGYIRESAQHMARLIDDLLSLFRLGKVECHYARVDLVSITRTIVERLRSDQPGRVVELVVPAKIEVNGDPQLLEIVLESLLGNAWKFTSRRDKACIELGQLREEGRTVLFVRDNGAGFDMQYAGKLFEVFQRLHKVSEFAGSGVGLASAQRIIHRHGGRIWAEGEVERGATFYFTLGEVM